MKTMPSLLAPAGNMRALQTALRFGADAVLCGAKQYGLRAQARPISTKNVEEAVRLAHAAGAQVNLTRNIFAFDGDLDGMVRTAQGRDVGVDAAIVSDLGAIARCAGSAGAGCAREHAGEHDEQRIRPGVQGAGAKRVVLAREMTFEQIEAMSAAIGDEIELETFIHGAACMSYSGRCMLSSLNGRSANRGACSQPCRWTYTLRERTRPEEAMPIEEDERERRFLQPGHLHDGASAEADESGVCCFQDRGRMKTKSTSRRSSGRIAERWTHTRKSPAGYQADAALQARLRGELDKISHRVYDTGFYFRPAEGLRRGGRRDTGSGIHGLCAGCFRRGSAGGDEEPFLCRRRAGNRHAEGQRKAGHRGSRTS